MIFREFKFEFKVIVLLFVGLILVSVIGFATYNRLVRLFDTVHTASRPDMGLVLTHVIQNDVMELSSIVKTKVLGFDVVREEDYTSAKQNLLAHLHTFNRYHERAYNNGVRIVDSLVYQKIYVSDELFYAENTHRVQKALSKVVYSIDRSLNKAAVEPLKVKETVVIKEKIVEEKRPEPISLTIPVEEDKKKKKVFGNKKSKAAQDSLDAMQLAKAIVQQNAAPVVTRSVVVTEKVVDTVKQGKVNYKKVYDGIRKVREEEIEIENRLKDSHYDLIKYDEILDRELQENFDQLKKIELDDVKRATMKADSEAKQTWKQIIILSIFVALLLFFLGYLILQFTRRNALYRKAIQRSAKESKEFVLAKERFMSNFSHELRTPMHAIQGFAELLSKENLEDNQKSYVQMIQKSTQHMGYLLNDVLDLAKLRNHKLKIVKNPVDISALIAEVWEYAKQLNQRNNVEMVLINKLPKEYVVTTDTYRVRQILLNILSNAIKFTEEGNVTLTVENKRIDGLNYVSIEVQDTGIGMSQIEVQQIFEEYTQARAEISHQYGGTGLGMAITKKLIELLDGTILVISEKGIGTTMKVLIPTKVATEVEEKKVIKAQKTDWHVKRVLVVDDELYNRKYLEGILKEVMTDLHFAESAEQGKEIIRNNEIDLILLDYRLPGMNGIEFVQWLNGQDLIVRPKVIILSAAIDDEQYDELLAVKVDGVLGKPFSSDKLYTEVQRIYTKKEEMLDPTQIEEETHIDFHALKLMFGQDDAFYKDMLETYISSSDESIDTMRLALMQNDIHLIGHEAHKIASPTKHIGAAELYQLLKQVEKLALIQTDISVFQTKFKEIETIYQVVKSKITLELNAMNG